MLPFRPVTHTPNTLTPDTVVHDKYRIVRLLAEGGMGAVYRAVQEPLGRDVALKILKPQDDTPQKRAQREKRFLREAAVSSKLTHPNTIVILDYGKLPDDDGFFLVMEYLEGKSLRELLLERGSLGTRVTLHIAMQMAGSLADAHRQGAIHRDLKPPNVMLVSRGGDPFFVKIVDFGLVKQLDPEEGDEELTADNHLVGSPMYMAPERFLSTSSDAPAVDVYSIGIMIYEMLVGRPPFIREGDSTLQHIMMQHIQDDPPRMVEFRPDLELSPGLEELVMRCLAKHPDDRIQSMDTLLTMLKTCAAGAGLAVAGVVEDTGAFVAPADRPRDSGALVAPDEDSGDATVLDRERVAAPPSVATSPPSTTRSPVLAIIAVAAALAVAFGLVFAMWPAKTTHIVVNSTPTGATVWLNDQELGSTPFDGALDLQDAATIRVQKDGFEPFEYRMLPRPGDEVMVEARLVAVPAAVTKDESPQDPEPPADAGVRDVATPPVSKTEPAKGEPAKTTKKRDPDIKMTR